MNTISTYTGKSFFDLPIGSEPTKQELGRRIQILEGILQAVIDHLGEKEKVVLGPMATEMKYIIYEAPEGTEKHVGE